MWTSLLVKETTYLICDLQDLLSVSALWSHQASEVYRCSTSALVWIFLFLSAPHLHLFPESWSPKFLMLSPLLSLLSITISFCPLLNLHLSVHHGRSQTNWQTCCVKFYLHENGEEKFIWTRLHFLWISQHEQKVCLCFVNVSFGYIQGWIYSPQEHLSSAIHKKKRCFDFLNMKKTKNKAT